MNIDWYPEFTIPVPLLLMLTSLPLLADSIEEKAQDDVRMLNFTVGEVGIADNIDDPLRFGVEYRARSFFKWKIIPAFGYARAGNGASFLYSDLRRDFWLSDRWVLIPSFGLGTFGNSEEINLGSKLEFRSGLEIAYRFHDQYRIGLGVFHLSNGGIAASNPGTEALVLSLCIPLDRKRRL